MIASPHPAPTSNVVVLPIAARWHSAADKARAALACWGYLYAGVEPPPGVVVLDHARAPMEKPIG